MDTSNKFKDRIIVLARSNQNTVIKCYSNDYYTKRVSTFLQ